MKYRAILAVLALMVLGDGFTWSGCDSDGSAGLSRSDWTTFEGTSVSLMLPDYFVGGDPRHQAVIASMQERAASATDPDARQHLDFLLNEIDRAVEYPGAEQLGWLLCAWGEPGPDGWLPEVRVERLPLDSLRFFLAGGDTSMEALLKAAQEDSHWSEWTVKQLTEDRAYVLTVRTREIPYDQTEREHVVFRVAGGYLYEFHYTYCGDSNALLDNVFAESAETAIVKGYDEQPRKALDLSPLLRPTATLWPTPPPERLVLGCDQRSHDVRSLYSILRLHITGDNKLLSQACSTAQLRLPSSSRPPGP